MTYFGETTIAPTHLPIEATDEALAKAVIEEIEGVILWRAVVGQTRRILIDGPLPSLIEFEPVTALTSITMYTPTDSAAVIDANSYNFVSRDPHGAIIVPKSSWPAPQRSIGSFEINYQSGWTVTPETADGAGDAVNLVPASVQVMLERAISFRAGSGLGNIEIGSLTMDVADSYKTDKLPREITDIARRWFYRPGIISARP